MRTLDLSRLRAVHTVDGRVYHPADVLFEVDEPPITCVLCGRPVQGVRCPDGCEPLIVTGED